MDVIYTSSRGLPSCSRRIATLKTMISCIVWWRIGPHIFKFRKGKREVMDLRDYIRDVPDFPKPGILFKDITPLLGNAKAFDYAISQLAETYENVIFDSIALVESRGFLFGSPLARELGKSIVLVRKPGKLPAETYATDYDLEYGTNTLEIHVDGIQKGQTVLIIDDLLATGGTLSATARLVEMAGAIVSGIGVIIELSFLDGRKNLSKYDVNSLVQYWTREK